MKVVAALWGAALLLAGSCARNELCYDHQHGNVQVCVMWDKLPEGVQQRPPESVCLAFYPAEPTVGECRFYYRGTDGGQASVGEGTYDLLVYNADTEMVMFRGMEKLETAEAYLAERTRQAYTSRGDNGRRVSYAAGSVANAATREESLIGQPDRLFATWLGTVGVHTGTKGARQTVDVHPGNRVMTLSLGVAVSGLEKARSCRGSLSGVARSFRLGCGECGGQTGTMIFDLDKQDDEHITCSVRLFGLNKSPEGTAPDERIQHILQLEFVLVDNQVHICEFDIGDQIDFDQLQPDVEIPLEIEKPVELPEVKLPEGGFDAEVGGWGDEVVDDMK